MLAQLHDDAADEDEPMLPLAQMGLMFVDWLDPQKLMSVSCPFLSPVVTDWTID